MTEGLQFFSYLAAFYHILEVSVWTAGTEDVYIKHFVVFIIHSKQIFEYYLKIEHDYFVSYPSQFIIHIQSPI
jgi:hypothetical protein